MLWMMVLLIPALGALMMCILILGKRADHRNGLLLNLSLQDLQEADAFSPLPRRTEVLCKWRSFRPQQNPL